MGPIALFHAPILGAGTSISELFRLGGASGAGARWGLLGYDWEYEQPIVEGGDYREGGIVSAATARLGLGGRVINQDPLNLGERVVTGTAACSEPA